MSDCVSTAKRKGFEVRFIFGGSSSLIEHASQSVIFSLLQVGSPYVAHQATPNFQPTSPTFSQGENGLSAGGLKKL